MQIMEARPPFVEFEARSEENREETIKTGMKQFRDIDYAIVRQIGSKDTVEVEVEEWFRRLEVEAGNGRFPQQWIGLFRQKYDSWKNGQSGPVNGFPIREWAAISRGQADTLIALGVSSVEDLAAANEQTIAKIPMGRSLKDRAKAFLDTANKKKSSEELAALRVQAATQKDELAELRARLATLEAENKALTGRAERKAG